MNNIDFNMNNYIKIRLNDTGDNILEGRYKSIGINDNQIREWINDLYKKDDEGYIKIQMWEFINIFGKEFHMGNNNIPCDMNIKICMEER